MKSEINGLIVKTILNKTNKTVSFWAGQIKVTCKSL